MTKIPLSISIEKTNSVYTHTPISGKMIVRPEKTQSGVNKISITHAIPASCTDSSPKTGDECTIYGENGSGKCILMQKSVIKEGGSSAVPYVTESLVFVGV